MLNDRRKDAENRRLSPGHFNHGQVGAKPAWRLRVWQQGKGDADPILATDRYWFDLGALWPWLVLEFGYLDDPDSGDNLQVDRACCWADKDLAGNMWDYWAWLQPGKMIHGQWVKETCNAPA